MVNTILTPASAGVITFLLKRPGRSLDKHLKFDRGTTAYGLLAGCVSSCACADRIEGWAAIILGFTTSIMYSLACLLLEKYKIDDPLEAF